MPDGPKISAEVLEEDGFGDNKFFHCLVAQIDSQVQYFFYYFDKHSFILKYMSQEKNNIEIY